MVSPGNESCAGGAASARFLKGFGAQHEADGALRIATGSISPADLSCSLLPPDNRLHGVSATDFSSAAQLHPVAYSLCH
jgi:hypothetical protein